MIRNKIDEISDMKKKRRPLLNELMKLRSTVSQLNDVDSTIKTLQKKIQENESSIESLKLTNKTVEQEIVTLRKSVAILPQLTEKEQELTDTLSSTEEKINESMKDLHNSIIEEVQSLKLVRMSYSYTRRALEPSYFSVKDEPKINYEDTGSMVIFTINYGFEREVKFDNIDTIMDTLLKMKDDCVESFESEECAFALAMAEFDITETSERKIHERLFHDAWITKVGNEVEWTEPNPPQYWSNATFKYTHFTSWITGNYIVKDKEQMVKEYGEVTKDWQCDITHKRAWWAEKDEDFDFFPVRDFDGLWVCNQAWEFMDKYLALISTQQVTAPQAPQALALRF